MEYCQGHMSSVQQEKQFQPKVRGWERILTRSITVNRTAGNGKHQRRKNRGCLSLRRKLHCIILNNFSGHRLRTALQSYANHDVHQLLFSKPIHMVGKCIPTIHMVGMCMVPPPPLSWCRRQNVLFVIVVRESLHVYINFAKIHVYSVQWFAETRRKW